MFSLIGMSRIPVQSFGYAISDAVAGSIQDKLVEHRNYICKHGEDMPEIRDWKWGAIDAGKLV